ncbi:MAG: ATP-dependent helicase [Thermoanaerobaculia bacterium]
MPTRLDLETDLNPQQREAVTHGSGPQLVLAGAGSGKTRVITYRVAWLVRELGVPPEAVVAVTFTNKAAGEMQERIESLLGVTPLPTFVGTFHRFALGLLRRWGSRVGVPSGFVIFDRDDQIAAVKKALKEEGIAESSFQPRQVLSAISAAKNRLVGPSDYEGSADGFYARKVAPVYRQYQTLLRESSAVDFDDMLRLAVRLLDDEEEVRGRLRNRIAYLLVDEFQDTNHAQMRLVHDLIGADGNLTAVGDEDQGIYRWRGADLDNVLEFERYFHGATVRKLERNYRSTQAILDTASALVEHNQRRRPKRLWTDLEGGDLPELYRGRDEGDEARWLVSALKDLPDTPLSQTAILVRTNAQTRAFEEEMMRRGLPYELVGGVRFYERAEIKDLVAYLRLLRNPSDNLALLRVLNQPPRGIGQATRGLLLAEADELGGSIWAALGQVEHGSYPRRGAAALVGFRKLIEGLREAAEELPLPALLDRLLDDTKYPELYQDDNPESEARLENLREFLTAAQEFTERPERSEDDTLSEFLDHVALVTDIDTWHRDRGLTLMTLHSAKGLEFDAVAVAGLEEGLLPHANSQGEPDDLEEERRLLYVGMTRARKRLFLGCCRRRRIAGRYQDQEESPFIQEIPADGLVVHESPELFHGRRTRGVYDFFGRGRSRPAPSFEAESSAGALRRGGRVRHPTLGDGVVLEVEGSGDDLKLTVFFHRAGKRKILARYAALEPL